MPAGTWEPGTDVVKKLTYPIGDKVSNLVKRGWLSLATTERGSAHVWVQGPNGGIEDYPLDLPKDKRVWRELPNGTDQVTLHYTSGGPVGWCLELEPR